MFRRLVAITMSSFEPPIRPPPPIFGVTLDLGGRKWYKSLIPIRHLYTLYANLAPFGYNTQRGTQTTDGRQTERWERAADML